MTKDITPRAIAQIKVAARRLGKEFPSYKHTELLDLCAHAFHGVSDYEEALRASEQILPQPRPGTKATVHSALGHAASISRGDWFYYPEIKSVAFEGEFTPYVISLVQIDTAARLLDWTLQVQKKKWPKSVVNDHGVSPTYQVDEFLELINELCRFYFDDSIQGVFCPGGVSKDVDWRSAIAKKSSEIKQ